MLAESINGTWDNGLLGITCSKRRQIKDLLRFSVFFPFLIGGLWAPVASSNIFLQSFLFPKWLVVYGVALAGFSVLLVRGKLTLPYLSIFQRVTISILLSILVLNYFILDVDFRSISTLNRLSFFIIVLYSLSIFSSTNLPNLEITKLIALPFIVICSVFLIIATCQILLFYFDLDTINLNFLVNATFGNPNMYAQFLGFCLILALPILDQKSEIIKYNVPKVFFSATVVYIYYLQCRSVLLAVAIASIYLVCSRRLSLKSLFQIFAYAFFIVLILQIPKYSSKSIDTNNVALPSFSFLNSDNKKASANERLEIWKGTFQMIRENPLGVGADNFDYAFVPYKKNTKLLLTEDFIEKSPHSEYLRYLVEDGIPATILGIVFILYSLYLGIFTKGADPFLRDYFVTFLIFLSIEAFFQFPIENSIPFYICAILSGLFFARLGSAPHEISLRRVFIFIPFIIYASLVGCIALASYYTGTAIADRSKMQLAAKLDPSNWHTGLYQIEAAFKDGHYDDAIWYATLELKKRPYNFPALYLLGISQFTIGMFGKGCATLKAYDALFEERSRYHEHIEKLCVTN